MQIKVWLLGISPMVWRRLLMPSTCTLRELHGSIQVAMGWEGVHLYQFCLRAARYGSWELSASSPEVTLAAVRLRKGARFGTVARLGVRRPVGYFRVCSLTKGGCVAWMLRLVKTGAKGEGPCVDIMEIRRPDDLIDVANLGLTLAEAKQLLARIQREIVAA